MPTPILGTKSYVPHTYTNLVPRPRLIKRLDKSLVSEDKLTLISVTARFGKTIGIAGRFCQKAKYGTMNDGSYEVLAPHTLFRGDNV